MYLPHLPVETQIDKNQFCQTLASFVEWPERSAWYKLDDPTASEKQKLISLSSDDSSCHCIHHQQFANPTSRCQPSKVVDWTASEKQSSLVWAQITVFFAISQTTVSVALQSRIKFIWVLKRDSNTPVPAFAYNSDLKVVEMCTFRSRIIWPNSPCICVRFARTCDQHIQMICHRYWVLDSSLSLHIWRDS